MIQKHYNLTCYVLEYPITILHSFITQHFIYLIGRDHNIFQFDLAQTEYYQTIQGERQFKRIKRINGLMITLDDQNVFCMRQNQKQLLKQQKVQEFNIVKTNQHIFAVILKENRSISKTNEDLLVIKMVNKDQQAKMQIIGYKLQEYREEDEQTYSPALQTQPFTIKTFLHHYCICQTQQHTFIIKLLFNHINTQKHVISFQRLPFEFHQHLQIKSVFMDKIIAEQSKKIYFMDLQKIKIQEMNQLALPQKEFVVFNHFLIQIQQDYFHVVQTLKGNLMGRISISSILEEFEEEPKLNASLQRYYFLYEELKPKISHFYLFDREKTAIYYFNINKLIERTFVQDIKESLKLLENDSQNIHQKIIKTLGFRNKKLEGLQKYITQDLKNHGFGNTIRFLAGEQNIFVLNDGLKLFYHTLTINLERLTKRISDFQELERQILKLCAKLMMESKYEDHLENALFILNNMYTTLRKLQLLNNLGKNLQYYQKLFESKKMIKLLRQDKMKKLFELSYELCLKIKGFKTCDQLMKG